MNQLINIDSAAAEKHIWQLLETVPDPEVPVLSVIDLGIARKVQISYSAASKNWEGFIIITPTYSGCPAMDTISADILATLAEHGYTNLQVRSVLSPAWTTDWMSEAGKIKLKAYGIAPPNSSSQVCDTKLFAESIAIECPLCNSYHTELLSLFGSTACKALYRCIECKETFDYFKCH